MPNIEICIFDEKSLQWNSFYDTFKSLIQENAELRPVQKYHFLKNVLIDRAASVIVSPIESEENCLVSCKLLQKRYDDAVTFSIIMWHCRCS